MEQVQILGREAESLNIALSGDIDLGNAEAFYNEVMLAYREMPMHISFNCEKLTFIDSTTLGTFVKILKMAKTDGYAVRLTNLQPKIKKLFTICSLDKIIQLD